MEANKARSTRKFVALISRTLAASISKTITERKYKETCRGNIDHRIQGFPHSTVQKEDSNRREIEKRLVQQFENHPNRDSLMEEVNKTEEFSPFLEKLQELITSMG